MQNKLNLLITPESGIHPTLSKQEAIDWIRQYRKNYCKLCIYKVRCIKSGGGYNRFLLPWVEYCGRCNVKSVEWPIKYCPSCGQYLL